MRVLSEFKEFAVKGSVVDMAVGIIIGAAFGTVIQSLVKDILMPPVGLLLGDTDLANLFVILQEGNPAGPYATLEAARAAGAVVIAYGTFVTALLAFLIVGFAMFLFIKWVNRLRRQEESGEAPVTPSQKTCPWCASSIPIVATRCPACTSELDAEG